MNQFAKFMSFLPLVQFVVAGVEQIHSDADGATKKQLAQEALGLAVTTAGQALPGEAPLVNAAGQATSVMIDQTVNLFNALGLFKSKTPAVAPAMQVPAPIASTPGTVGQ